MFFLCPWQSVASQLGVGASGDCGDILKNISCLVTESEERRRVAEKRAKVIEDKYLDSSMKNQVLELELAEVRRERDTALDNLQVNILPFKWWNMRRKMIACLPKKRSLMINVNLLKIKLLFVSFQDLTWEPSICTPASCQTPRISW